MGFLTLYKTLIIDIEKDYVLSAVSDGRELKSDINKKQLDKNPVNFISGRYDNNILEKIMKELRQEYKEYKNVKKAVINMPSLGERRDEGTLRGLLIKHGFSKNRMVPNCKAISMFYGLRDGLIIEAREYTHISPIIKSYFIPELAEQYIGYNRIKLIEKEMKRNNYDISFEEIMEKEFFDKDEGLPHLISELLRKIDINERKEIKEKVYVVGKLTWENRFKNLFKKHLKPVLKNEPHITDNNFLSVFMGLFEYSKN